MLRRNYCFYLINGLIDIDHLPVWQLSLPSCEVVVPGAQVEHSESLLMVEVKVPLGQGAQAPVSESLKYPGTHSEIYAKYISFEQIDKTFSWQ